MVEFDGDEDEFVIADVGEVVDEAFFRMQIVKMPRVAGAVGDLGNPAVAEAGLAFSIGQNRPEIWPVVTMRGQGLARSQTQMPSR